ncbi:MAG: hypothetical protein ACI38R_11035 [Rhodococcus sp. (in: high G+C Gram-positive bacteria)]
MSEWIPILDTVTLSRDADYVRTWERHPADPAFPPGTTAELVITRTSSKSSPVLARWEAADVTSDAVSFWVQSEQTYEIPPNSWFRLMIYYPPIAEGAETQDWCWYRGPVRRND